MWKIIIYTLEKRQHVNLEIVGTGSAVAFDVFICVALILYLVFFFHLTRWISIIFLILIVILNSFALFYIELETERFLESLEDIRALSGYDLSDGIVSKRPFVIANLILIALMIVAIKANRIKSRWF